MRVLGWIFLVLLVLAGLLTGVGMVFHRSVTADMDKGTSVRIEPVVRGTLVERVQAPGEVQPLSKVSISAKTTSRIVELPFKEGDAVKTGDVVVKLDSTDLEAALRAAEARFAAQKAQLKVEQSRVAAALSQIEGLRATLADAQRELAREQGLLAGKIVAQSVVDDAQRRVDEQKAALDAAMHNADAEASSIDVLKHTLDGAEADITMARQNLSYTIIASPLDGVVTRINAKVGEMVITGTMNNPGTVIMEVADLSRMLVVANVDESDVAAVKEGQPAAVHIQAYPDRVFHGVVRSVSLVQGSSESRTTSLDNSKYYRTEILLDAADEKIYSGWTADVEIETRKHEGVLKVPSQAVLGRPVDDLPAAVRDGSAEVDKTRAIAAVVYRVVDGKAVVTPVKEGPSDLTHTIIRSGLKEGELVIVGPYKALEKMANDQKVMDEKAASTQPATKTAVAGGGGRANRGGAVE